MIVPRNTIELRLYGNYLTPKGDMSATVEGRPCANAKNKAVQKDCQRCAVATLSVSREIQLTSRKF
jgi:hypothetical protein